MTNLTEYQKNALEFENHIALTANAGSGKTFVLAKRFVKIAVETDSPVNSIVAITFTDKAASELYVKISREINSLLSDEENPVRRKKILQIRAELINAKISTIHSFCSDILREFPSEAGIDSSFIIIDEQQRDELVEMVIDEFINVNLQNGNEKIKKLIRIFGSVILTKKIFENVISNSTTINELKDNFYNKTPQEIEEYYEKLKMKLFNEYFLKRLPEFKSEFLFLNELVEDKGKAGEKKIFVNEQLQKLNSDDSVRNVLDVLHSFLEIVFTKSFTLLKRGYLNSEISDNYSSKINFIGDFVKEYLAVFGTNDLTNLHLIAFSKDAIELFSELVEKYEEKKYRLSYLDFEDLMSKTVKIIKEEKILDALKVKYKYIMIDEYQDTNEIQYEIFMPILDELKHGNLFIVGDEKQSIYRFRNAELEVFNKTKNEIKQKSSQNILELPHSFRLSPKLAFFTNSIFEKLFENPTEYFNEVANSNLVSTRNDLETGGVEFLIANGEITEPQLIANKIMLLVKGGKISFNDIAILSKRKLPFFELEKEFIKCNIPYVTIGGRGFYQRQLIFDINNYLMFLINPLNDLALIGILRSPFFYLSDREIFLISLEEGESFYKKLENYSSKSQVIEKICSVLKNNINRTNEYSPTNLIIKLMLESGYYSVIMSRINADQELANFEKLLSITRSFMKSGFKSLFDLSEYLKTASSEIEDEGQAAVRTESNAVKLLTIHKAKGLEFKVVFLIDTNSQPIMNSVAAKDLIIDKEYGLLTKLPSDNLFEEYKNFEINKVYNFRNKKKEIAELKRLLYVGITRAIDYLFISVTLKEGKITGNSFFDFISKTLNFNAEMKTLSLSGKLDLLIDSDGAFINKSVDMNLEIPVNCHPIDDVSLNINKSSFEFPVKSLNVNIDSKISDEIISATKIAVFSQCPRKYNLLYNLGLGEIIKKTKNIHFDDEFSVDVENKIQANIAGSIIHNFLQQEPTKENLDAVLSNSIRNHINTLSEINLENLHKELKQQLEKYFKSDIYSRLSSYRNYFNEYQIYLKENDYFLFGIMDKIILEEKLIIVDYKTDVINEKNIQKKIEHYYNQLMFYAFISSKYFDFHKKAEINLVFIKSPELSYSREIDQTEILSFGGKIYKIIQEIRNENFAPDLNHCQSCVFCVDKNCIADKEI